MKALHFGAGNIGRGFIGLNLAKSGYAVTFVDVSQVLIDELNARNGYLVDFVGATPFSEVVNGVSALNINDVASVTQAFCDADIVTTAIGPHILPHIAPVIATGLQARLEQSGSPVNIIACENMTGGSSALKTHVFSHIPESQHDKINSIAGFPDAAVDRIVPIQKNEDILTVKTEIYQEWDIDLRGCIGEPPQLDGAHWVEDLTPYIERKLYTINTSHTAIAWLGAYYGFRTIGESLADERVRLTINAVLDESAAFLLDRHDFSESAHRDYIHTTLERFKNPEIVDGVRRVGRSPGRKLRADERIIYPASQAMKLGVVPHGLATAAAAALLYEDIDDEESMQIRRNIISDGVEQVVTQLTGLQAGEPLYQLILQKYMLLSGKNRS